MSEVLSKDSEKFSSYSCILNCSFSISSMLLIPVLLYPRINNSDRIFAGHNFNRDPWAEENGGIIGVPVNKRRDNFSLVTQKI